LILKVAKFILPPYIKNKLEDFLPLANLAQQVTDILAPSCLSYMLGYSCASKTDEMLLEEGIEKLGSKAIDRAKSLWLKISSK
jgi:hypothetical protein